MITLKHDIPLDVAMFPAINKRGRNVKTTWQDLVNTLSVTERTAETIKQYLSYDKTKQGKIKDVGGFIIGYCKGGSHAKKDVVYRQGISLDIDYGQLTEVWGNVNLLEIPAVMYSTHKHTPDSNRGRIVIPLSRQVTPDEYEAITRQVASWLGIDAFDDTTYQFNRVMYNPSTSKDGEYIFMYSDAPALNPDKVLAELPDWRDPTTWPVSSREKDKLHTRTATDKVEDPLEKDGVIGAFCRAYPMYDALAEFLQEVYTPCPDLGDDRYSLVGGSTSGGLVVYDNKLAYSHHATDVAGGKLCNAFDLVRLHKFADLDEGKKSDTEVTKLPSFKAMTEFAGKLPGVKKEVIRAKRDSAASDYDDIEDEARKVATSDEWIGELETEGRNGALKQTIDNAVRILNNDENLKGRLGYNEFEQRETAISPLPWDNKYIHKYPRPLTDADDAELRLYLERCYDMTSKGAITDALTIVVRANSYHPVRDYLDPLEWDGVARLDALFIRMFGAADTEYTRAVTRKAFTAAVARIYRPGIKYDYVLTLVGHQGQGKSTSLKLMGDPWFNESMEVVTGKEAMEQIQGSWIVEIAELEAIRKADVAGVKQFISKCEDRFRVAYGKRVEHFPRRCVFFGTTNEEDFLRDVTGNRRFWVLNIKGKTGEVYWRDYLTRETINQLWAEAKHYYEQGEPLYLHTEELEEMARSIQDGHLETDERSGLVREYLERLLPDNWGTFDLQRRRLWLADENSVGTEERQRVCVLEVWAECLDRDPNNITRRDSFEISRIMKSIRGWEQAGKAIKFKIYGVQKGFEKVTKKVTKVTKTENPENLVTAER